MRPISADPPSGTSSHGSYQHPTYAATQAATKALPYRAAGLRVPLAAQLAGGLTEGLLHAVIDDGRLLARFAAATGKQRFRDLASGGVNGRMLLDQAAHHQLQILAGAVITTVVSRGCTGR